MDLHTVQGGVQNTQREGGGRERVCVRVCVCACVCVFQAFKKLCRIVHCLVYDFLLPLPCGQFELLLLNRFAEPPLFRQVSVHGWSITVLVPMELCHCITHCPTLEVRVLRGELTSKSVETFNVTSRVATCEIVKKRGC